MLIDKLLFSDKVPILLKKNLDFQSERNMLISGNIGNINTPGYIANLHKLFDKSQKGGLKDKEIFTSACNFIGLLSENKNEWLDFKKTKLNISEDEIRDKISERNNARDNKKYELADKIRKELLDKGVLIEDKNGKTIWKFK